MTIGRACVAMLLLQVPALAATYTGATGGEWGTPGNWDTGVPNAQGAVAAINTALTVNVSDTGLGGAYPYTFGTLSTNIASNSVVIGSTAVTTDILRAEVLSGTPEIGVSASGGTIFYYANLEGTQGFNKTGAGKLSFRYNPHDQAYSGPITITGGVLAINQDGSLGNANNDITIANGARLSYEPGSGSGTATLPATRSITLTGAQSQIGASGSGATLVIEGAVTEDAAGRGLTKTDAGTVRLAGTVSYSGDTRVVGGVLDLNTGTFAQGGAVLVNGGSGTKLDLTDLTSFTMTAPTKTFVVQPATSASGTYTVEAVLSPVANSITALSMTIGGASGSSQGESNTGALRLGASNFINVNSLTIGGFNGRGAVDLQAGLTTPAVTVRATDGASAVSTVVIGDTSSGQRSGGGIVDLTGANADIAATGIILGRHIANANNTATSTMTVTDGSVTATSMVVSEKVNGGVPANVTTVTQKGTADVSVDHITLGQAGYGAAATGQLYQATYLLEGGTLTASSVSGFAQVEHVPANGTVSTAGSLAVTVTGADFGAPVVVNVPVSSGDTPTGGSATDWTVKVANALNANATLFAKYHATRLNNIIMLTRRAGGSVDGTLNIALANGTAAGITEVTTSTDTVAARNTSSGIARNLILLGGNLVNKAGADLSISGVSVVVSGVTTTAVDSTPGQKVVLANDVTYSSRINSGNETAGTLTVDGDLDLSAQPAFFIFDDAAAPVELTPGTKLVLIDYTFGSLTGTFAGLPDGATVDVVKGAVTNSFVIDYDDLGGTAVTLTIPAAGGFAGWAAANGIPGEPFDGDFDGDGLANGLEYALGLAPAASTLPAGTLTGDTIVYTKGADAILNGDVQWIIEVSEDLTPESWVPAVTQPAGNASATIEHTLVPGPSGRQFARLSAVQVP